MQGLKTFCAGKVAVSLSLLVAAFGNLLSPVQAQVVTFQNLNSSMTVNVTQGLGGMTSWSVDGVNQAAAQWVYFGIGSGPQHPIDFLSATPTIAASPTNSLDVTYDNGSISARVKYTLTGGASGSGISQFGETIAFNNHSGTNLTLHLFDYSEFDLGGASDNNQNLQWVNTPPLASTNRFWQAVGSLSLTNTFTSVPNPTRYEANIDGSTLASLLSGSAYTLNNQASAFGDVTGALEWDVTLANGAGLTISKVVNLQVPEPSVAALLGLGLLLLRFVRGKTQKF
jgi:hypothetical protein